MEMYRSHKEIPQKYRRIILEEVFEKRVAKVPLATCNEIINNYLAEQEEMESLKDFRVVAVKAGQKHQGQFKTLQDAEVMCDRLIEYGENLTDVQIALYQAKRLVRVFFKSEWHYAGNSIYQ